MTGYQHESVLRQNQSFNSCDAFKGAVAFYRFHPGRITGSSGSGRQRFWMTKVLSPRLDNLYHPLTIKAEHRHENGSRLILPRQHRYINHFHRTLCESLNVGPTQMMSQQQSIAQLLCYFTMFLRTHWCLRPPAGPVGVAVRKHKSSPKEKHSHRDPRGPPYFSNLKIPH